MDSPAFPQTSPLHLAGHLNGAADVSRFQAEAGVKVLFSRNGCRVGGAGCLLHRGLSGPPGQELVLSVKRMCHTHSGLSQPSPREAHRSVGRVLLGHPQEGLEWSLPPWEGVEEAMRESWATPQPVFSHCLPRSLHWVADSDRKREASTLPGVAESWHRTTE